MELIRCWVADLKQQEQIADHTHEYMEIISFVSGSGKISLGGKNYKVRRNSFAVIPAGQSHDQRQSTDMKTICVLVKNSGIHDLYGIWHDHSGSVRRTSERLWVEHEVSCVARDIVMKGMLYELVGFCCRSAERKSASSSELLNMSLKIIYDLDGFISVGKLASRLAVSSDYLRHLFKRHLKKSPMQMIIERRIEKAKDLLACEDISIKSIAHQIGCDDEYYFSRMFKKATNMSPTAFRNQLLKGNENSGRQD